MRPPRRHQQLLRFDRKLRRKHKLAGRWVAGLDEAGRGPLAGPVVAAAAILRKTSFSIRIDDSKRLSPRQREEAFQSILSGAWIGIGWVGPEEIDRIGIHPATHRAMVQAVKNLSRLPAAVLVDGPWTPAGLPVPSIPVVHGDGLSLSIACASIVAKVFRDRLMVKIDQLLPEYRFRRNKGYPTPDHLEVLRTIGPSLFHRYSFRPIKTVDELMNG